MIIKKSLFFIILLIELSAGCKSNLPGVHFAGWDYDHMKNVKSDLKNSSSFYMPAFNKLVSDAEAAMNKGPFSVTYKSVVPPGGTKNDYMSYGPYWWPDSTKPNGLPYKRHDGIRNPQSGIDHEQLSNLINSTRTLSLAWFFTGDKKYAKKAVQLLRVWFIEPETKMNPHMEYAQGIPGITNGRGIGIIDVRGFYTVVDAISLLESSGEITDNDMSEIKKWFADFFTWLTTSKNGIDEDNYKNNHSVAYDVLVTGIARFLGNDDYVRKKISEVPSRRINPMIKSDGSQSEELIRTNAYGYSVSNLRNFFDAGETGLKVGVDIFSYVSPEGGSVRKALDFLIQYVGNEQEWKWQQIGGFTGPENNLGLIIRRAARIYNDQIYQKLWEEKFSEKLKTDWNLLVVPGFEYK